MSTRGSDASRPPSRSKNRPAAAPASLERSSSSTSSHPFALPSSSSPRSHSKAEHGLNGSQPRKRKLVSYALEDLLKPFISIKPQLAIGAASQIPVVLMPLMLLAREHLPLSSLDLSTPNGDLPTGPGRFFESHIRILDLEGRLRQAPSVLVARSEDHRNVYAIEKYQPHLYVVCKIGSWVNIEKLAQVAEASYASRCSANQHREEAPTVTAQLVKTDKKKRKAIEDFQSEIRKRSRAQSVAPNESQREQSQALALEPIPSANDPQIPQISRPGSIDPIVDLQTSADDIFEWVRSQYFEMLYHSKGSLAYFAKGPLSRARAAFHSDSDTNLDLNDLIQFLKGLVVAIQPIDKKYKETVPRLIDDMKMLANFSDEEAPKPKRKKSKKMKLGKDGLWTSEVDHVKKWWRTNKPEHRNEDDDIIINPQEVKYHVSCLRSRETQLQMILLLEILALEAIRPAQDAQDTKSPGMAAEAIPKEKATELAPRKKDKHDLPTLINLHADRMSIWQSTTLDDMSMIAAEAHARSGRGAEKSERINSDPLKDFCIDIIVPFFAGRLPDICTDLNRKLGGPVAVTPPKPKKPTASIPGKVAARPGAATKRPTAAMACQSLEKALESEKRTASRRPVDVLARMRSATPAAIPGVKREASEPLSLERMASGNKSLKERSRNLLSRSVSSVDVVDLKAQKKAKVEAELKEAISALKKPNRQLAGASLAEEKAKLTASSSSPRPRKQKKPVRNAAAAAANRVQVKATPANFRFRDAMATNSRGYGQLNPPPLPPMTDYDMVPSSSSVVPATDLRKSFRDDIRDDLAAFHIASTPDKILATPVAARAAPSQSIKAGAAFLPPSSPIMLRKASTSSRKHPAIPEEDEPEPSSPTLPRLFETPIKQRPPTPAFFANGDLITSTPPAPSRARPVIFATPVKKATPPTSIPPPPPAAEVKTEILPNTNNGPPALTLYQQMGWDDDFDALIS